MNARTWRIARAHLATNKYRDVLVDFFLLKSRFQIEVSSYAASQGAGPDGDLEKRTIFFSIKPNIHQTLMRDWLGPVHCSRTILQKQFRKMYRMRQPPAVGIPGLPNWPSPLHNDASTPQSHVRPLALRLETRHPRPHAHATTDISRSAITIISIYDGWPEARYFPSALHVNFIHKNACSTAGSTFNSSEIMSLLPTSGLNLTHASTPLRAKVCQRSALYTVGKKNRKESGDLNRVPPDFSRMAKM